MMRVARQEKEKLKLGVKEREELCKLKEGEEEGNQLLCKMQERLKVGWLHVYLDWIREANFIENFRQILISSPKSMGWLGGFTSLGLCPK